jgi:hypothetical protein
LLGAWGFAEFSSPDNLSDYGISGDMHLLDLMACRSMLKPPQGQGRLGKSTHQPACRFGLNARNLSVLGLFGLRQQRHGPPVRRSHLVTKHPFNGVACLPLLSGFNPQF